MDLLEEIEFGMKVFVRKWKCPQRMTKCESAVKVVRACNEAVYGFPSMEV